MIVLFLPRRLRFAGQNVTDLRAALNWSTPAVTADLATSGNDQPEHAGHTGHTGGDPDGATGIELWQQPAMDPRQGAG
ncbi:hypothetical protein ACWCOV_33730 [Kribbella sp. NPDC002412]